MGVYKITLPNGETQELWVLLYQEVENHIKWLGFEVADCEIEKVVG